MAIEIKNLATSIGGTGGTSSVDGSVFTPNSDYGTPSMGVYEATPSTVTSGDAAVIGITEDRELKTSGTITGTVVVDGSGVTQPISAVALPLPSGASTETKQDTGNTSLSTIAGDTTSLDVKTPSLGQALESASTPVVLPLTQITDLTPQTDALTDVELRASAVPVSTTSLPLPSGAATSINQLPDGHNVTIDNEAGVSAVNIQDGGNSITIDNTDISTVAGAVSGTEMQVDVITHPNLSHATDSVQIGDGTNLAEVNSSGELKVVAGGHIDTGNSTSTPLLASGVFTGVSIDILDIAIIQLSIKSDVASAVDGLNIQFSSNGTNWDLTDVFTVPADSGKVYSFQPAAQYMRVVYTNGGTDQVYLRLQVLLKHTNTKPSSHRIQDNLIDEDDGELAISVLKLRTAQDQYVSGSATTSGNFKISLEEYNGSIKNSGLPTRGAFQTNDIDEASSTVTYIGMESEDGTWWIKKISTVSNVVFSHATITTDPTRTTYTLAWTNRATLSYTDFGGAF